MTTIRQIEGDNETWSLETDGPEYMLMHVYDHGPRATIPIPGNVLEALARGVRERSQIVDGRQTVIPFLGRRRG